MAYGDIRKMLGLAPSVNLKESRTYRIWCSARQRTMRETHHAYGCYGARGVVMCARWDSFLLFLTDMGNPPTNAHTLDRINNSGPYAPDNCRWATPAEQNRNRSNTILVNGVCLKDAALAAGLRYDTVWARIHKHGWTTDAALNTPVTQRRK